MRKLTFAMNVSLDGYVAAPGDDLGWSVPSDEVFQWWSDRVGATSLALYGRRLWETMSPFWPTADQHPDVTPEQIEYAQRWVEMPKVVFSSTISELKGNARLVSGDAATEISRLKAEDGGGIPFFTALDEWVDLTLVETRSFAGGVLLTRYETRR